MMKEYDYIVYGASVQGVTLALMKASQGHSVLMLDRFAEAGGTVTECLNCWQKIKGEPLTATVKSILKDIRKDKSGILFEDNDSILLNPDSLSGVLDKKMSEAGVDIIYNAKFKNAYMEEEGDQRHFITLEREEGDLNLMTGKLADLAYDHKLAIMEEIFIPTIIGVYYNIFLNEDAVINLNDFENIHREIDLDDGRKWVSFKISIPEDGEVDAGQSQSLLSDLMIRLSNIDKRKIIFPRRANYIGVFRAEMETEEGDQKSIKMKSEYEQEQLFIKSAYLEETAVEW